MAVQIRQNGKWVSANTGIKLDSSLSNVGEAAEAAAVGAAIANLKNNTKVTAIDFSQWDSGHLYVYLADESILEFLITFKDGVPTAITDNENTTTNIYWK